MKQIKFLGLSVLFLFLIACGQKAEKVAQTEIPADWKLLEQNGYSINYPGDWDLDQSGQNGTIFYLFSKQTSAQDQFRENINMMTEDLTGKNMNLTKYILLSEVQLKTGIPSYNLIEKKRLNCNGVDFEQLIYTGQMGAFNFKFVQCFWIANEKAYILTLTCNVDEFDNYKATGEQIMYSFKLK